MTDTLYPEITEDAVHRMSEAPNARLREVMAVVVRHLHDAVREARISEAEWETAIRFLTKTGQKCDAERQEFILLSDVLGVSMLVDALNHEGGDGITESTVFGPFYSGQQRVVPFGASILLRPEDAEPLVMSGRVLSADGTPVAGAIIEVWQTAPNGLYDVQDPDQPKGHLRATLEADQDGAYAFETILPVSYAIPDDGPVGQLLHGLGRHPNRPAHIHFMISATGYQRLVTHLFVEGDPYLESDAVFGVKPSLIVAPVDDGSGRLKIERDFGLSVNEAVESGD
ncbi:hydroxyquinol 1,2-dioxygenase [Sphingomonas sp. PP-F2F-A104-K0414]|uniref:dioxygenase family protein n=1 Tax=Sphingomonas sp. PP-F2F-A104-K0414 TaxID=2135661 RepID=UPI0010432FC8|nr:dioxygenase [Sphingomonas sp. PP-F2F-A104-K0414]TCP95858.1 hydroxyquinol 1,2-dioxygenase [Sphingomonas sp. PP-F2F-A104-K0414]